MVSPFYLYSHSAVHWWSLLPVASHANWCLPECPGGEEEEEELNEGGRDPAIEQETKLITSSAFPFPVTFASDNSVSPLSFPSPTAAVFALPLHAPSSAQRFSKCGMKIEWKVGKRRERYGFRQTRKQFALRRCNIRGLR